MQQRVDQPAFGELHFVPAFQVPNDVQVRDGFVHPARDAEWICVFDRHIPVADLMVPAILALAILPVVSGLAHCPPGVWLVGDRFQSAQIQYIREEAERVVALDALKVFKKNQSSTRVTIKSFHFQMVAR